MKVFLLLAIILVAITCGCERKKGAMEAIQINLAELKNIPQYDWDRLAGTRIYFGHQSIGFNIIEGMLEISRELPSIRLKIKEINKPGILNKLAFFHSQIGENLNPISKCDDFKRMMEGGVGDSADLAFFKFCYVDINKDTDIDHVFKYYVQTISYLKEKYPKVVFIHFTVPLTVVTNNSEAELNNMKREDFNELLKEKFKQEDPIFDLARYESTDIEGNEKFFEIRIKKYHSLLPEYSYDGGHLNKMGRVIIAKHFLSFITKIVINNLDH